MGWLTFFFRKFNIFVLLQLRHPQVQPTRTYRAVLNALMLAGVGQPFGIGLHQKLRHRLGNEQRRNYTTCLDTNQHISLQSACGVNKAGSTLGDPPFSNQSHSINLRV